MTLNLSSSISEGIETIILQGELNEQVVTDLLRMTVFDEIATYSNDRIELIRYHPHVFPQQYLNRVSQQLSNEDVEVLV